MPSTFIPCTNTFWYSVLIKSHIKTEFPNHSCLCCCTVCLRLFDWSPAKTVQSADRAFCATPFQHLRCSSLILIFFTHIHFHFLHLTFKTLAYSISFHMSACELSLFIKHVTNTCLEHFKLLSSLLFLPLSCILSVLFVWFIPYSVDHFHWKKREIEKICYISFSGTKYIAFTVKWY